MKKKNCTLAGHRPNNLSNGNNDNLPQNLLIKRQLEEEIIKKINDGYSDFYCGMEIGCELWAGEIVLALKKNPDYQNLGIRLIAVLASEEQANDWDDDTRDLYFDSLSECDEVVYTSNQLIVDGLLLRNGYLAKYTDCLIAVFAGDKDSNTADLIKRMQEKDREIVMIPLKPE